MPAQHPLPLGRKVRVGIVGLGSISRLTLRGWAEAADDAEVVALCDRSQAALDDVPLDVTKVTDVADLPDVDLVEVAVPSPLHASVVVPLLERGLHVSVQKPMASSLADADRMRDAARANGVLLRVTEDYLHYEPLERLKQIVDSGEIGAPAGFHMKMVGTGLGGWVVPGEAWVWQMEETRLGRGIMTFDDSWHKYAVARWLFGPIRRVWADIVFTEYGGGYGIDAPATVVWDHESGVRGVMDVLSAPQMVWPSDYYSCDERFEVTGELGFARAQRCTARGLGWPALEVYSDGALRTETGLDDDWGSTFGRQSASLARWMRTGEGSYALTADMAFEVLQMALAVGESSRTGGWVGLSSTGVPTA